MSAMKRLDARNIDVRDVEVFIVVFSCRNRDSLGEVKFGARSQNVYVKHRM
jgi:hypothetical protein